LESEATGWTRVTERRGIPPAQAYLERRFGAGSISSLTKTNFRDWPASTYSFGWSEEGEAVEPSVLLLAVGGETYRIISDPRSALNARAIATITAAD
jgi:hypothetical protein